MSYTPPSITPSGTTFAQFQAGGASGHLERLIAAQSASGTPAPVAAPTLAASGSGNALPANTYYVVITETNGFGETTPSPASIGQAVASGQQLTVTFPSLQPGNVARNVYLGTASTGPFTLYATGVTTATYNGTAAPPTNSYAVRPPTINTTGLSYADANGIVNSMVYQLLRAAKDGNVEDLYRYLRTIIEEFNAGRAMTFPSVVQKLRHAHVAIALLNQLCSEMGSLIDANPGHLTTLTIGLGYPQGVRTWP
jgi:hypothetical protein